MQPNDEGLQWTRAEWLRAAHEWIHDELALLDLTPEGPIEQPHVRPWSTVLKVPTDRGRVWFKASPPALAHEARVIEVLAQVRRDNVPRLLATDPSTGWMLQADSGPRLSNLMRDRWDIVRFEDAMSVYAELQGEVARSSADLIEAGAFDRRLEVLPLQFEELLENRDALGLGTDGGISREELSHLWSRAPQIRAMCSELAATRIPETIQHDDLSDADVAVGDRTYRFFDWGDACVAHPFFAPFIALRVLAMRFDLEPSAPELKRVTAAYLEPWSEYGSRAELNRAYEIAQQLAGVCRTLTWHRTLSSPGPAYQDPEGDPVVGWLREVLRERS
ncbi:MAG: aminoglycoside phosphotransferase family protein [Actinomycetota bacterium]|nr:aminoglycoside phosphotransferase family protein [Actinomycetota bacterium]